MLGLVIGIIADALEKETAFFIGAELVVVVKQVLRPRGFPWRRHFGINSF